MFGVMEKHEWQEDLAKLGHLWWKQCILGSSLSWLHVAHCWHRPKWRAVSLQPQQMQACADSCYRAKYPLAVTNKLIDCFRSNLAAGYDINCSFTTTLFNSIVGPRTLLSNHALLIGAFHGHVHRRLCQLKNLATYIDGLGLDDLETCECTFSKSNTLAATTRHASLFHRQQVISLYIFHAQQWIWNLC